MRMGRVGPSHCWLGTVQTTFEAEGGWEGGEDERWMPDMPARDPPDSAKVPLQVVVV